MGVHVFLLQLVTKLQARVSCGYQQLWSYFRQVNADKKSLKILKTYSVAVNWYVWLVSTCVSLAYYSNVVFL